MSSLFTVKKLHTDNMLCAWLWCYLECNCGQNRAWAKRSTSKRILDREQSCFLKRNERPAPISLFYTTSLNHALAWPRMSCCFFCFVVFFSFFGVGGCNLRGAGCNLSWLLSDNEWTNLVWLWAGKRSEKQNFLPLHSVHMLWCATWTIRHVNLTGTE